MDPDFHKLKTADNEDLDYDTVLFKAMDQVPKKITPSDAGLLMLHRYETDYGIYNHDADRNPYSMALMEMHPAENTIAECKLYERMRRFAKSKVGEVFRISFTEFINQPTYIVLEMFKIADEIAAKENAATDNSLNDLDAALRGKP